MTFGNVSASGITFPASVSASGNANTLDDYEEGTWTPTDGSGAGLSFSSVVATYVKIGQSVFVTAKLIYPVTANGNQAIISGFPFTSFNSTGVQYNLTMTVATTVNGGLAVGISPNATEGYLRKIDNGIPFNSAVSSTTVYFNGYYRAST
jgi:hypothetical protein